MILAEATSARHSADDPPIQIRKIAVDCIEIGDRLRQPTEEQIAAVARSMQEIGLRTPITIRLHDRVERNGRIERGVPILVTGATRLAAAKRLGWKEIAAQVLHDSDTAIALPIGAVPASGASIKAEHLAQAIATLKAGGAFEPVRVRQKLGPGGTAWEVVEGHRRLEAARRLGLEKIDAVIVASLDDALWEIDENLARAELTPAEVAEHMARRKEIWGQKNYAQSLRENASRGRPKEFTGETAERTGRSKRAIQQAVSRGEKIAPDVLHAVEGTKLDTGVALDQLAKLPVDQQHEVAKAGAFPAPQPTPQPATRPAASPHARIIEILRQHIPHDDLERLLSEAAVLPAGTTFSMVVRAALRDSGGAL